MKKVVYLLVLLLLIPCVLSRISIDNTLNEKYNVGDVISLRGSIQESDNLDGTLNIIQVCDRSSFVVGARYFRLDKNVAKEFSQDITTTQGSCYLYLYFLSGNASADSLNSNSYIVSNELIGNFELNNKDFQLGENLIIKGNVMRLDNSNVNGIATVSILKDSIPYIVSSTNIINSKVNFITDLINLPAGVYNVEVEAKDVRGNIFIFDVGNFNFYTDISIVPKSDKTSYLPGETVLINGTVEKRNGGVINDKLNIIFENLSYSTDIISNNFKINLGLAKNIKSYYHEIRFYVKDAYDNMGEKTVKIDVTPVPTTLSINTDKTSYLPGENIIITPILLDQAGDLLKNELNVIFEKENKIIVSNESYNYLIPQFKVGEIKIDAKSGKIESSIKINVNKYEYLDTKLAGQKLLIQNVGNIVWNKETNFTVGNEVITKGINLAPNESMKLDLIRYVDEGNYDVQFLNNSFKVSVIDDRNILEKGLDAGAELTGAAIYKGKNVLFSMDILYIIGGMILLTLFMMSYFKIDKILNKKENEKAKKFVAERLPGMQIETKAYKEIPRKPKYKFGHATEADIEDFKKVYFKKVMPEEDIKKYTAPSSYDFYKPRERKISYEVKEERPAPVERPSYSSYEKKEEPTQKKVEPGLFSMFG